MAWESGVSRPRSLPTWRGLARQTEPLRAQEALSQDKGSCPATVWRRAGLGPGPHICPLFLHMGKPGGYKRRPWRGSLTALRPRAV